jgi:hypothetical protein
VERWVRDEGLPFTPDRDRMLFDRTQVANWAASHGLTAQAGFLAPTASSVAAGGGVAALLHAGRIWRDVPAAEWRRFSRRSWRHCRCDAADPKSGGATAACAGRRGDRSGRWWLRAAASGDAHPRSVAIPARWRCCCCGSRSRCPSRRRTMYR